MTLILLLSISNVIGQNDSLLRVARFSSLKEQLLLTNISAKNILNSLNKEKLIPINYSKRVKNEIDIFDSLLKIRKPIDSSYIRLLSNKYSFITESIIDKLDSLQNNKVSISNITLKYRRLFFKKYFLAEVAIQYYDDLNWLKKEYLFGNYVPRTLEPI